MLLECPEKEIREAFGEILINTMRCFFQHGGVSVSLAVYSTCINLHTCNTDVCPLRSPAPADRFAPNSLRVAVVVRPCLMADLNIFSSQGGHSGKVFFTAAISGCMFSHCSTKRHATVHPVPTSLLQTQQCFSALVEALLSP